MPVRHVVFFVTSAPIKWGKLTKTPRSRPSENRTARNARLYVGAQSSLARSFRTARFACSAASCSLAPKFILTWVFSQFWTTEQDAGAGGASQEASKEKRELQGGSFRSFFSAQTTIKVKAGGIFFFWLEYGKSFWDDLFLPHIFKRLLWLFSFIRSLPIV